ncbi:DUF305 domain-containing protein [Cellulomonas carbonis]|uniref:DUF305 domain-containing protein n=1 Tax=Cellulomonas carbonis T26 TaxID=947969 RepID=A0A0A0BQ32_9CELL|nr:DUF305 domain-containing protein [Cellulomonas carbonis]KGM10075.1 hypothetical protein N868_16745 [Cellulomonas carbonis T26]MDT0167115.1 DUF305 domain-containing protein [Actinotalea sp. AC32]GGC18438.1 hypothetical protein GCM10010972_34620 [Cellulomonas carbonis]
MTYARRVPRAATATAASLLTLTLAACGTATVDEGAPTAPSPAPGAQDAVTAEAFNGADTEFAEMMIVHHEGAIEMAELAIENADSDEVRSLGHRIAAARGPEIDMLTGWLGAWGQELPGEMDMGGMDDGAMQMDTMDQETVMAELSGLSGSDFDRRFLELMIEHHRGAIEMAENYRGEGEDLEALRLSGSIIDAQMAESTEMGNLLRAL